MGPKPFFHTDDPGVILQIDVALEQLPDFLFCFSPDAVVDDFLHMGKQIGLKLVFDGENIHRLSRLGLKGGQQTAVDRTAQSV